MPALEQYSKELLGGIWAYEIYRAIVTLTEGKDEIEVAAVRALTDVPDKDASVVSKQLGRLARLKLLERLNYRGRFRRVDDQFWASITALVNAWEAQGPPG